MLTLNNEVLFALTPFSQGRHLDPSTRVTFTAILDLAHSKGRECNLTGEVNWALSFQDEGRKIPGFSRPVFS
jgi:hypothetical protein